jgi:prevent-host-death family protein
MKTFSSREFNQNVSIIKKESANGPVFITDRGKPSYVLMSIEEYNRLLGEQQNIVSLLSMSEAAEIDFDIPKKSMDLYKPEEFS